MATDPAAQLLMQIGQLMSQYMQLGPDTPLAPVFAEVLPQIEQGMQGMGPGEVPPGGEMPPGQGPPMEGGPPMPGGSPQEAGAAAVEALAGLQGGPQDEFRQASKQAAMDGADQGPPKKKKGKGQ